MLTDPVEIAKALTAEQQKCILAMSDEWQELGYNKVQADILYALGGSDLHRTYAEIVDCDYHRPEGRSPNYRHRLLPLGLEVKIALLDMLENTEG